MPLESELLNPLCAWFRDEYGQGRRMLIHEEPQGRGGRRPDMLVVIAEPARETVDQVYVIPVEIENSSKGAIHDPHNGLRQLRRYPGNAKYLAIPKAVARRTTVHEIRYRCEKWGAGLLVVDQETFMVDSVVEPLWQDPDRSIRAYPVAMQRWIALRKSGDSFRRISGRRIIEQE